MTSNLLKAYMATSIPRSVPLSSTLNKTHTEDLNAAFSTLQSAVLNATAAQPSSHLQQASLNEPALKALLEGQNLLVRLLERCENQLSGLNQVNEALLESVRAQEVSLFYFMSYFHVSLKERDSRRGH